MTDYSELIGFMHNPETRQAYGSFAAAALEAQAARIAALEAALKPFAEQAGVVEAIYDAGVAIDDNLAVVKISTLRAARAAYLGEKE